VTKFVDHTNQIQWPKPKRRPNACNLQKRQETVSKAAEQEQRRRPHTKGPTMKPADELTDSRKERISDHGTTTKQGRNVRKPGRSGLIKMECGPMIELV